MQWEGRGRGCILGGAHLRGAHLRGAHLGALPTPAAQGQQRGLPSSLGVGASEAGTRSECLGC